MAFSAEEEGGEGTGAGPRGNRPLEDPSDPVARGHEVLQRELDALFRSHHNELHRLAFLFVRSQDEAEDVVQNVYLRLLFRGPSVLPLKLGYVAQAVANAARDALRRKSARHRAMVRWTLEVSLPPPGPEFESRFHRAASLLSEALGTIPLGQRQVFQRIHVEGATYREVAAERGITVEAVIQQAWRARRSLRERLQSLGLRSLEDL